MLDWITDTKIPVGATARRVFDWLQANGGFVFDGISDGCRP
jgi:glycine betaine/proline transport system permease protein